MTGLTQHPASLLVAVVIVVLLVRLGITAFQRKGREAVSITPLESPWRYVMCFAAGVLLTNFLAHFTHGISAEPFPAPFGFLLGGGSVGAQLSNVLWGFLNLVLGYGLLVRAGVAKLGTRGAAVCFAGVLVMGIFLSLVFSH